MQRILHLEQRHLVTGMAGSRSKPHLLPAASLMRTVIISTNRALIHGVEGFHLTPITNGLCRSHMVSSKNLNRYIPAKMSTAPLHPFNTANGVLENLLPTSQHCGA